MTTFSSVVDNLGRIGRDFLFPQRCLGCGRAGGWLCSSCQVGLPYVVAQECLVCGRPAIGGFTHPACETRYTPDRLLATFSFSKPLRIALQRAKYYGEWSILGDLALWWARWLVEIGVQFLPGAVLVPVPLHRLRRWERGYDQTRLLSEYLGRELDLEICGELLSRRRYTLSQTRFSKSGRRANIRGAFRSSEAVRGQNLVVIDDVCTSGSTLLEASRALKRGHSRSVWCLTLFRAGHQWL